MNTKPTRYYSKKQENRTAKNLGGSTTSNSGAPAFCAGDVKLNDFLIECKTMTKESQSMKVNKEWLIKSEEEALSQHKRFSAVAIDFGGEDNYYIINEKTFKYFIQCLKELEDNSDE